MENIQEVLQMEANKYVIFVATPKSEADFKETPMGKTVWRVIGLRDSVILEVVYDNTVGLPYLYNKAMSKYPEHKILFVHDDVEIHDLFVFDKLDLAFEMFDVVGLAGAKSADFSRFDNDNPRLMWHLMADRNNLSGFVPHYFGNNVWAGSSFGSTPSRVVLIDGLFIAVDSKKCLENNVSFDRRFDFHFYDLSFSLRANEAKLKVGTYPIFVVHHGLGNVDNMDEFLDAQSSFNMVYAPK